MTKKIKKPKIILTIEYQNGGLYTSARIPPELTCAMVVQLEIMKQKLINSKYENDLVMDFKE